VALAPCEAGHPASRVGQRIPSDWAGLARARNHEPGFAFFAAMLLLSLALFCTLLQFSYFLSFSLFVWISVVTFIII